MIGLPQAVPYPDVLLAMEPEGFRCRGGVGLLFMSAFFESPVGLEMSPLTVALLLRLHRSFLP